MVRDQKSETREAHQVYNLHVKPVEHIHEGEYVVVMPDGQMIFAPTLVEVMQRAQAQASPANFIFKVGDVVVGNLRSPRRGRVPAC